MFVISSSQLGAREKDIANSMQLMKGPAVRHYWDDGQRVGAAVQHYVEGLDYPAWDFWMLYKPDVVWGDDAPRPDWWEHQLGSLSREHSERRLDATRFVLKARELSQK